MQNTPTTKQALRRKFRSLRMAIDPCNHAAGSAAVCSRLLSLPEFQGAGAALVFVSSLENELDTHGLIETLIAKGTQVWVPKVVSKTMGWVPIPSLDVLQPGHFGVLEPIDMSTVPVPPDAPVVVPGLAFTLEGFRLGYGGGYFDRFLAGHRGLSFGVAFECQVTGELPVEPHDVPVRYLVTEERSCVCSGVQGAGGME